MTALAPWGSPLTPPAEARPPFAPASPSLAEPPAFAPSAPPVPPPPSPSASPSPQACVDPSAPWRIDLAVLDGPLLSRTPVRTEEDAAAVCTAVIGDLDGPLGLGLSLAPAGRLLVLSVAVRTPDGWSVVRQDIVMPEGVPQ